MLAGDIAMRIASSSAVVIRFRYHRRIRWMFRWMTDECEA